MRFALSDEEHVHVAPSSIINRDKGTRRGAKCTLGQHHVGSLNRGKSSTNVQSLRPEARRKEQGKKRSSSSRRDLDVKPHPSHLQRAGVGMRFAFLWSAETQAGDKGWDAVVELALLAGTGTVTQV
jgi:hypothetical protein